MDASFAQLCVKHSQNTQNWVIQQIAENGKLTQYPDDLVCYYKLPYLLTTSGKHVLASHLLDYMKTTFFIEKNAITFKIKKTDNPLMAKFWGYVLGWVAIASQKLGRFDISFPAHEYLAQFQSQDHGGFSTSDPWGTNVDEMDIITSAQLGRLALYFGQSKQAIKAGEFLIWNINQQPQIQKQMYLFVNNQKKHMQDFPEDFSFIYQLKTNEPNQAYFMIGLPCAFLVELYLATNNQAFLTAAKQYGDYAISCHESIKRFHFSHKVAWAMSLLYKVTKQEKYLAFCKSIASYLIEIQDQSGVWLKSQGAIDSLDQSVENAIWLNEIAINLS